jgi:hypothetical protein
MPSLATAMFCLMSKLPVPAPGTFGSLKATALVPKP